MSDWNPLELRKRTPRQPSPELRTRIFATDAHPAVALGFDVRELTRWIVPVFGCFLLVMASLSSHLHPRYGIALAETNFVLPPLTDDSPGIMPASRTEHSMMNSIPAKTLEWSFGPRNAATSVGTILIAYTNKLIR
jgi:hypothetical protein